MTGSASGTSAVCSTAARSGVERGTQTTRDWRASKRECESECAVRSDCDGDSSITKNIFARRSLANIVSSPDKLAELGALGDSLKQALLLQQQALVQLQTAYEKWTEAKTAHPTYSTHAA